MAGIASSQDTPTPSQNKRTCPESFRVLPKSLAELSLRQIDVAGINPKPQSRSGITPCRINPQLPDETIGTLNLSLEPARRHMVDENAEEYRRGDGADGLW